MSYNLKSCTDIETLNVVFQKLAEPFHEAFNEATKDIEAEYFEACKEPLAAFDEEVKDVLAEANAAYAKIEREHKEKMEAIRLEALRRIRTVEGKLKKQQDKLQAAYYADPIVSAAQAKLKAATAEAEAKRDEALQPHVHRLQEAMLPLKAEYEEALREVAGGTKLRRYVPEGQAN